MDWQKLLTTFDGRINREPFWYGTLVLFAANLAISLVLGGGVIAAVLSIALLYPSVCVAVKRWHDRGKSGWWVLIGLIPVIGWIWTIVECGFLEGVAGANEYGPNPLASA